MSAQTFSEAIKVKDGHFCNLPYHIARMERTAQHFFGKGIQCALTTDDIPAEMRSGLVKCRIVYSDKIIGTEFTPYSFKQINTVAIVQDDDIEYTYKSTDRSRLEGLLRGSGCDEIIIIKNGCVTDSSAANLVFEDSSGLLYTPDTYLLAGTKREYLLTNRLISERHTSIDALLSHTTKIHLINAMTDLHDNVIFPKHIITQL